MGTPYKMKKSPMKRNFGIGSPVKKATDPKKVSFEQRTKDFWNQPAENRVSSEEPKRAKPKAKTTTPKKGKSLVGRTVDKIHKNEMKIGELKKSRAKDIKKVKGNTVKISKKEVLGQMKKAGSKLPYSSVKNALKTSIKAAGKIAKFVPGVAGLVLGATKTATADQPKGKAKKRGSYTSDFTKLK